MLSGAAHIITLVALSCIAAYVVFRLIRYGRSGGWPETIAHVESYGKFRHLDDAGSRSLSFADIAYSYTVDGDIYSGQFLSPTLQNDDALTAFLQEHLPIGQAVKIRYNPRHPERSIIREDVSFREEEITGLHITGPR
jgi:Protein of unknown function (DUF3592)